MNVTVLLSFTMIDPAYSLCNVAEDQLAMLLRAGYAPRVVMGRKVRYGQWPWNDQRIEWRFLPEFARHNDPTWKPEFAAQADALEAALREILPETGKVITHDLIYQSAEALLNLAARRVAAERPGLWWLHWVHSASSPTLMRTAIPELAPCKPPFPNSFLVFPNETSRRRLCVNFGYEEDLIKCVPHPTDPFTFFGMSELVRRYCEDVRLLDADVVITYPLRLDTGKNARDVVKVAGGFYRIGLLPCLVFCDFHSTGEEKCAVRDACKVEASRLGIAGQVHWVSEWEYEGQRPFAVHAPRTFVAALTLLSDFRVVPSRSETYSLVLQEGGLAGCGLLCNGSFPPMREIYPEAIFREFGGDIDPVTLLDGGTVVKYEPDENTYMRDVAIRLRYELEHNPILRQRNRIRRERNPDAVFRKYIQPLLGYDPPGASGPARLMGRLLPPETKGKRGEEMPDQKDMVIAERGFILSVGPAEPEVLPEAPIAPPVEADPPSPEPASAQPFLAGQGQAPFFSVIVPVRNRVAALRRALSSLRAQSFGDFEAIVVDDASDPDKRAAWALDWMGDARFHLVEMPRQGERVLARLAGMAQARGKWICWLDSDDEYAGHYLEVVHQAAEDNPEAEAFNFGAVVHHRTEQGGRIVYTDTSIRPTFKSTWQADKGCHQEFKSGKIGCGSFVFKRSLLDEMEILPPARSYDELSKMATDVHHLYEPGKPLGNPWGDDWLAFYRLTRRHRSIPLGPALYIQHVRVGGHDG